MCNMMWFLFWRRGIVMGLALLLAACAVAQPAPVAAASLRPPVHVNAAVSGARHRGPNGGAVSGYAVPLGVMPSNPFALCANNIAYIIGFHLSDGRFVEGIQPKWVAVQTQLLYLWCPTWLTAFFPDGINFAELQIRNTSSVCQVYALGKPEPGFGISARTPVLVNAYAGVSLVNSTGTRVVTAFTGPSTQRLCPGQRMTLFSGAADGRSAYYALAIFDVTDDDSVASGWTTLYTTPYPR